MSEPGDFLDLRDLVVKLGELPAEERQEYLRRNDLGTELGQQAMALLAFERDSDDFATVAPEPQVEPPIELRVGRYRVVRTLGVGGMGIVYLAIDPNLDREVAIKVLTGFSKDDEGLDRLRQEARLLARLNHPNIATIYSLESDQLHVFLTMEVVRGQSLAERLAEKSMAVDETLSVGRQLASAIDAAHSEGVVHRDLKPANVMLTDDGLVKVLDFGVARLLGARDVGGAVRPEAPVRQLGATRSGIEGTPGYMSPEQLRGDRPDHRTDVFSFGCVLYECMTGRPAFGGPARQRVVATLDENPVLEPLPREMPNALGELVLSCLVKDRDARLTTMRLARQRIDGIAEERAVERLRARIGGRREPSRTNLPGYVTQFLGRRTEIAAVTEMLDRYRLVTITGPGGAGKTRTAIEVAGASVQHFADGVWFVDLASIQEADHVLQILLQALSVTEEPHRAAIDTLIDRLRHGRALLLFDNCEHLVVVCQRLISTILDQCDDIRVLVTSRQQLHLPGERVYPLRPLEVPMEAESSLDEVRHNDALQLFVDRAKAADPDFELTERSAPFVLEVCRQVEGMPLAIELAAARARALTPEEILEHLRRSHLRFLRRDQTTPVPRHDSIRGVLDSSYEQLTPAQQRLFRRLAIFQRGWTLDATERVCTGDGVEDWETLDLIAALIGQSLIGRDTATLGNERESRYRMPETIREYAMACLIEAGDLEDTKIRHIDYYLELVQRCGGGSTEHWRLQADEENIRVALTSFDEAGVSPLDAARVALEMFSFWQFAGRWQEARRYYTAFASRLLTEGMEDTETYAAVLRAAGVLAQSQGDCTGARSALRESMEVARRTGASELLCQVLASLSSLEKDESNFDQARSYLDQLLGVATERSSATLQFEALFHRANLDAHQCRYEEAISAYRRCLDVCDAMGEAGQRSRGLALAGIAQIEGVRGEFDHARRLFEEGLAIRRGLNDQPGIAYSLICLGKLVLLGMASPQDRERRAQARRLLEEGLQLAEQFDFARLSEMALLELAELEAMEGHFDQSRSRIKRAEDVAGESQDRWFQAEMMIQTAFVDLQQARFESARDLARAALTLAEGASLTMTVADALNVLTAANRGLGQVHTAALCLAAGHRVRGEIGIASAVWKQAWLADEDVTLRGILGEESYDQVCERARSLPLDDLLSDIRE